MRPFFGLSNRLSSILISFIIFGYSIYVIISERIISVEGIKITRLSNLRSSSPSPAPPPCRKATGGIEYDFESTTTSLFGLYEIEISIMKVCTSFLLFIILLVGAGQRSKILLKIWMMVHAIVIILGFIATLISLTDSHVNNTGEPSNTITRFLITLAFSLWFFAIVLSLHEDLELADSISEYAEENSRGKIRNCTYIAKNGRNVEEKCPPYYDC